MTDIHEKQQPQDQGAKPDGEESKCSDPSINSSAKTPTSYSPIQTCNEVPIMMHTENQHVGNRVKEIKEEYDTIIAKKNKEIEIEQRLRRDLEDRLKSLEDRLKSQLRQSETNLMRKDDKINRLVIENSSLQEKLQVTTSQYDTISRETNTALMKNGVQINELVIEKSSLEQQLKTEKNQHDATKRKLTDLVIKADEKRELQKKRKDWWKRIRP